MGEQHFGRHVNRATFHTTPAGLLDSINSIFLGRVRQVSLSKPSLFRLVLATTLLSVNAKDAKSTFRRTVVVYGQQTNTVGTPKYSTTVGCSQGSNTAKAHKYSTQCIPKYGATKNYLSLIRPTRATIRNTASPASRRSYIIPCH